MFTFRFRQLISIAMIASLFVARFAYVPHVHEASGAEQDLTHASRPHIHVGNTAGSKHGHRHSHGKSHSHAHKCTTKGKNKTLGLSLAFTVSHDQDAVYLVQSPVSLSIRSKFQVEKDQLIDIQSICPSFLEHHNRPVVASDYWHLPDKYRHCPIYLLTMSIRC